MTYDSNDKLMITLGFILLTFSIILLLFSIGEQDAATKQVEIAAGILLSLMGFCSLYLVKRLHNER